MSSNGSQMPKSGVRRQRITTAIMGGLIGVFSGWSEGIVAVLIFLILGAALGYAAGGLVARSREAGIRLRERKKNGNNRS